MFLIKLFCREQKYIQRRLFMPFIIYFVLSFIIIYIPLPTILFLFFNLTNEYSGVIVIYKIIIFILLILDIKLGYGLLYNQKIKKNIYIIFLCLNLAEELIHIYFFCVFHISILFILCIIQILLIICALLFPISKKFRNFLF